MPNPEDFWLYALWFTAVGCLLVQTFLILCYRLYPRCLTLWRHALCDSGILYFSKVISLTWMQLLSLTKDSFVLKVHSTCRICFTSALVRKQNHSKSLANFPAKFSHLGGRMQGLRFDCGQSKGRQHLARILNMSPIKKINLISIICVAPRLYMQTFSKYLI